MPRSLVSIKVFYLFHVKSVYLKVNKRKKKDKKTISNNGQIITQHGFSENVHRDMGISNKENV